MQRRFRFDHETLRKILYGAIIALSGGIGTVILQYLDSDSNIFPPIVFIVVCIIINVCREAIKGDLAFNSYTIKRIGRGFIYALSSTAGIKLLEYIKGIDLGKSSPLFFAIICIIINACREFMKGDSNGTATRI